MKRFLVKFTLYALPITMVVGIYLGIPWYIGEGYSLDDVITRQQEPASLLYDTNFNQRLAYKFQSVLSRQPQILVMGSSRNQQFRSAFFNNGNHSMYNGAVQTLDMRYTRIFLENVLAHDTPEIILLGVDQIAFNGAYERFWPQLEFAPENVPSLADRAAIMWDDISKLQNPLNWQDVLLRRDPIYGGAALGIRSIVSGEGYRNDGSYQWGYLLTDPDIQQKQRDLMSSIIRTDPIYLRGDTLNEASVDDLEAVLLMAQQYQIQVIGFFPPFAPTTYRTMQEVGGYEYIELAKQAVETIFATYEYPFYDFTDALAWGISDEMMLDHWHPSERASLMLYLHMLENEPLILRPLSDVDALARALAQSPHPYQIFEIPQ